MAEQLTSEERDRFILSIAGDWRVYSDERGWMSGQLPGLLDEVAQLRADLQDQRDNRNRDLRAFLACIKERDGLRSEVSRLEEVLDAVRNWRLCMSVASEMAPFERQLLAALEQYQAYWTARERAAQGQGEREQG
jgi:hypothetical protein